MPDTIRMPSRALLVHQGPYTYGFMGRYWGPIIRDFSRYSPRFPKGMLGALVRRMAGPLVSRMVTSSGKPSILVPFISIWKAVKRWVQKRMHPRRVAALVAQNELLYLPPSGRGYLETRDRWRYHQGLRVTRAQKRKWGSF